MKSVALRFRVFSISGVFIALGILLLSAAVLWSDREDDWRSAEQSAMNVRTTISSDIAQTMRLVDLAILGAAEAIRTPGFDRAGSALKFRLLFSRAEAANDVGSIFVLDELGNIRFDSTSITPRAGNFADRDYFRVHRERDNVGLYISFPYESRLRDGSRSIALSRRMFNPDGSFAGVVVSGLSLSYFLEKFHAVALGDDSALALLRSDGILIARDPVLPDKVIDLSHSDNVRRFQAEHQGYFVGTAATDNVQRLFSFTHIDGLPLILSVGISTTEIMQGWRRKTWVLGSATLLLCAAVAYLSVLFERELSRRRRAEAELSCLAGTDPMTGLWNRRQFDRRFDLEWMRAWRTQQPIAVLFIDADNFKAFNDQYGHGAGDDLLRNIALVIERGIRAPGDFVARYGGEEFVVVLPDTPLAQACDVAQRLVRDVAALQVAHSASATPYASVSIGVAGMVPLGADGALRLLARADAALYEAKRQGRNRIEVA